MPICLESLEEKFREVEEASERRALDDPPIDEPLYHIPHATSSRPSKLAQVCMGPSHPNQAGSSSPTSTPSLLRAAKSTFCRTLAGPFISGDSDGNNIPEGDQRATEIERIAGRQTNPKTMGTRRLSRAKTRSQSLFVTSNTNVVIGVSVERTTTDCPGPTEPSWTVHAPNPRRARAFTIDFLPSNHPGPNLVGRAKEFAQRIRRKKEN
ncbi:hypothetical protein SCLCIDRAFT_119735 [Scleroderma citrinum Foug A]|uniref:Uncharacterized protein n=1 Tax=Scleroderma citrinum Foug A TaxID=1036808 RepID=A0A0C3E2R2_9AGAM|nr:hypothetical protein SCLCIDRAFT_119735 [Scleroderma citrinum Foug A]